MQKLVCQSVYNRGGLRRILKTSQFEVDDTLYYNVTIYDGATYSRQSKDHNIFRIK